ncbi:hypothetical protein GCM10017783_10660 [Deinococcus piscis]|uniref:VOC domain-containing protein n=1 Tax=Deinococcus piscis TaxID=394230 RepID=A0ABQ3K1T6_9DEIO|nr:hypothetical protein [Deinococcus piscis]GHG00386.1 hypothetical protein GCM10017783_10660 [Deinococcus piscis]
MNIQALTLHTRDLAALHDFYETFSGFYHVAFDIPRNRLAEAQAWLERRVPLLSDQDGTTCFVSGPHWNNTNLYFDDPAGNIMEFIARHSLEHDSDAVFDSSSVLHVSELGVVVPDVPQALAAMGRQYGLRPFGGQSDTFTALGGHDGMLIMVKEGRGWFPVGRPAVPAPFELTFQSGSERHTIKGQPT